MQLNYPEHAITDSNGKLKVFNTILLILFSLSYLYSQKVTVLDQSTGEPLEMVTLISESDKTFATTNSRGKADISDFIGLELIEISCMGYKSVVISYTGLKIKGFLISLEPSNISLEEIVVSATGWRQNNQ